MRSGTDTHTFIFTVLCHDRERGPNELVTKLGNFWTNLRALKMNN